MFYVIPDILLKVMFNTNKTGHHVLCYTWPWWPVLLVFIDTFNNVSGKGITWWPVLLGFNDTFNNVSGITYNMVTSFIGIKLVTKFYAISDILLKVSLNTSKTGHHVIRYTWHIVESGIRHHDPNPNTWRPSISLETYKCMTNGY
jgi:hypothetical protein